jgi:hypothetical protein
MVESKIREFSPIITGRGVCSNELPLAFAGRGSLVGLGSQAVIFLSIAPAIEPRIAADRTQHRFGAH